MSLLRAGSALAMPPLAPIGRMELCRRLLAGRNDRKRSKPGEAASQGSKPQPASGQPGPSPASASGRNPHSARCTSVPDLPRFRALANCRRRLLLGGAGATVAGVRNPPQKRTVRCSRCRGQQDVWQRPQSGASRQHAGQTLLALANVFAQAARAPSFAVAPVAI